LSYLFSCLALCLLKPLCPSVRLCSCTNSKTPEGVFITFDTGHRSDKQSSNLRLHWARTVHTTKLLNVCMRFCTCESSNPCGVLASVRPPARAVRNKETNIRSRNLQTARTKSTMLVPHSLCLRLVSKPRTPCCIFCQTTYSRCCRTNGS
jgi:hypothetical protein